jgi:hypothetical protein
MAHTALVDMRRVAVAVVVVEGRNNNPGKIVEGIAASAALWR